MREQDTTIDPNATGIIVFSKIFRCPSTEAHPPRPETDPLATGWLKKAHNSHYRYNTAPRDDPPGADKSLG